MSGQQLANRRRSDGQGGYQRRRRCGGEITGDRLQGSSIKEAVTGRIHEEAVGC